MGIHRGKSIECSRFDRGCKYLLGLGSSSKISGIKFQKGLRLACESRTGVEVRRYKDSLRYGKIIDELEVSLIPFRNMP